MKVPNRKKNERKRIGLPLREKRICPKCGKPIEAGLSGHLIVPKFSFENEGNWLCDMFNEAVE